MIRGGNRIVDGPTDDAGCSAAMEAVKLRQFGNQEEANTRFGISSEQISATLFTSILVINKILNLDSLV